MKNYNHQKIDELLQPIMKMMQEEFPNNCKLIVEPYFSQIVYEHSEMVFPSEEMKKPLGETKPMENFVETFKRTFAPVIEDTAQTTPTAEKHYRYKKTGEVYTGQIYVNGECCTDGHGNEIILDYKENI